ncbi:uncharacterized protein LOC133332260 [Musca vetustissima]|uniref:uncharacterized protein LOC133332260 n=1 Tax=Musca vetustissima TaxID=27455 RepID=UPI002AB7BBD5|nr:uncharacterized protein LOC133332260 [Musca vetustissima]
MVRGTFPVMAVILVCGLVHSAMAGVAVTQSSRRPTKTKPTTTTSRSVDKTTQKYYHPAEVKEPRVIEQMDQRYLDGNYEYKYVLSNGVSRHEKSFWVPVGKSKVMGRKGYYSHPLSNGKYLTVFYSSDDKGYHQDSSTYSDRAPVLPRSLNVPHYDLPIETTTVPVAVVTKQKQKTKRPTRKPQAF